MPAVSEKQRRFLNWKKGHKWVKEHSFDNSGKLPEQAKKKARALGLCRYAKSIVSENDEGSDRLSALAERMKARINKVQKPVPSPVRKATVLGKVKPQKPKPTSDFGSLFEAEQMRRHVDSIIRYAAASKARRLARC